MLNSVGVYRLINGFHWCYFTPISVVQGSLTTSTSQLHLGSFADGWTDSIVPGWGLQKRLNTTQRGRYPVFFWKDYTPTQWNPPQRNKALFQGIGKGCLGFLPSTGVISGVITYSPYKGPKINFINGFHWGCTPIRTCPVMGNPEL